MTGNETRDLLLTAADLSYKEFNDRIANWDASLSIGVRVPKIREIAALVVKNGWEEYLEDMGRLYAQGAPLYHEEHMLWGMVIGKAKMDREQRVRHLDLWIPGILSWGDCDCSVSGFKFMKKDQEFWYGYCTRWLEGGREFEVRFALVALMQYFINDEYIGRVLPLFAGEKASSSSDTPYYIRMAQAWALSVCFVKYRYLTWEVFASRTLDPWVQNKAIQKCRESYRISEEDKELLKSLKI